MFLQCNLLFCINQLFFSFAYPVQWHENPIFLRFLNIWFVSTSNSKLLICFSIVVERIARAAAFRRSKLLVNSFHTIYSSLLPRISPIFPSLVYSDQSVYSSLFSYRHHLDFGMFSFLLSIKNQVEITGSYFSLAHAVEETKKHSRERVPSFVPSWLPDQGSNLGPVD